VTEQNADDCAVFFRQKATRDCENAYKYPVGEATTGIRIATAVQWRQCTIGQQDTSNQGVT